MNEENGERIGRDLAHNLFLFSLPFTSFFHPVLIGLPRIIKTIFMKIIRLPHYEFIICFTRYRIQIAIFAASGRPPPEFTPALRTIVYGRFFSQSNVHENVVVMC